MGHVLLEGVSPFDLPGVTKIEITTYGGRIVLNLRLPGDGSGAPMIVTVPLRATTALNLPLSADACWRSGAQRWAELLASPVNPLRFANSPFQTFSRRMWANPVSTKCGAGSEAFPYFRSIAWHMRPPGSSIIKTTLLPHLFSDLSAWHPSC